MKPKVEDVINNSDSPNNNNDNNNVLNNVLQYTKLFNTIRVVRSFSIPPDKIPIYQAFKEIAKREAGSRGFSEVLLKAMEEYVRRHSIPNPQITLDRVLTAGLPAKPSDVCCVANCKRKAKFLKQLRSYDGKTEVFQVCEVHKRWRPKDFPFLISFRKME